MGTQKTSPRSAGDSSFSMIDVGEKPATRRRAVASGVIEVGRESFERIRAKTMPKGDVLALAEVAGILAAKKASDTIPLCHPLFLEKVSLRFQLEEERAQVRVWCEAIATAKTGVEMEALAGVNAALLAIYDLTKIITPGLWISDIHLETKEGGKSGHWTHPGRGVLAATPGHAHSHAAGAGSLEGLSFGVVTISDRVSKGIAQDGSGPAIRALIEKNGGQVLVHGVVPDEVEEIAAKVRNFAIEAGCAIVITTGGTGIGPRDVTPEALAGIASRTIPGVGELLRAQGAQHTPMSWISRSVAVQVGDALVIALPGSEKAVQQGMNILLPLLPHARSMVEGGGH